MSEGVSYEPITVFELVWGNIVGNRWVISGTENTVASDTVGWRPGHIDATQFYIDIASPTLEPLPLKHFANTLLVAGNTITGIPTEMGGTWLYYYGTKALVDDGEWSLEGLSEDVVVTLMHPHYHMDRVTVTAGGSNE